MVICDLLSKHLQTVPQQDRKVATFSPLFLYYTARKSKTLERYNIALCFADIFAAIKESGICPEQYWPFLPHKFRQAPPAIAYEAAKSFRTISFQSMPQNLGVLKNTLAEGRQVAFGLSLFPDNQWEFYSGASAKTGVVTMPADFSHPSDHHALLLVAYQAEQQRFVFRNSFGLDWGDQGYGYIPEDYLLHPQGAFDFYTITSLTLQTNN